MLEIDEAFKQGQIEMLENLKRLYQGEYCGQLTKSIQQESVMASIDIQRQMSFFVSQVNPVDAN